MELNHRLQHVGPVSCRLTTGSWSDRGRSRTDKITSLSSWPLFQFAYRAGPARLTGFEPAIFSVTGRRGLRSSTDAHIDSLAQAGVEPAASFVLSEGGLPVAYRAVFNFRFGISDFGFEKESCDDARQIRNRKFEIRDFSGPGWTRTIVAWV